MYCMVQWIKQLSLHIRLNICYNTNNQNQQQDKLVNMVNGNDLVKHNYWPYIYLPYVFLNPDVYILKTEWYLDLYIAHYIYIFKQKNIADFFF